MKLRASHCVGLFSLVAASALIVGCGQSGNKSGQKDRGPAKDTGGAVATSGDHGAWWCPEHGVPEEECSMCSTKAAADFKKKGDWCQEHDRAESQCFICSPERFEKFAARYEAKFGEKPPTPEANMRKDEGKEDEK
jgi:hypothetical protein